MSEASASASAGFHPGGGPNYRLSDDLARLCLPQEFNDSCRTLAWVNSICFLFLLIGLVGLKAPRVVVRPISEATEAVPVVFEPPKELPKPETQVVQEEPTPTEEITTDVPEVANVVVAADPDTVLFPVVVPGAVQVAPAAKFATPPPAVIKPPAPKPIPTQFNPTVSKGTFPPPQYPALALRNRYQGTVVVEMTVNEEGKVTTARVQKSSGHPVLDEAALAVVKERWRFPQGPVRYYFWPCVFQLK